MSTGFTSPTPAQPTSPSSPGAKLAFHLQNGHTQHMDGRQSEYPQSGLSPYHAYNDNQSEGSSADQASAAQYPQGQDPRNANFSSSATPTSEYGLPPNSARSGSFPEYIQRQHYPPAGQGAPAGGMAQATSPSQPGPEGHANHQNGNSIRSDSEVPIDPSIAAASPTYPPPHQPYSPYQPQHEMQHYPAAHPGVYGRPEWAGPHYQTPPHMGHYGGQSSGPPTPSMVSPVQRPPTVGAYSHVNLGLHANNPAKGGHPLSTVYSFVPIPGAQQHKRPRRRYEEIERMYKCGWSGCEKAYGTLNHLNAHVTMQSHGPKRTPEGEKLESHVFPRLVLHVYLASHAIFVMQDGGNVFVCLASELARASVARAVLPGTSIARSAVCHLFGSGAWAGLLLTHIL
jgi:hypothetical protein